MATTFDLNAPQQGINIGSSPTPMTGSSLPIYTSSPQTTATTSDQYLGGTISSPPSTTTSTNTDSQTNTPAPAPTAQQIAQAQAVTDFNRNLGATNTSINSSIDRAGADYNGSILDYLDSMKASQRTIDASSVQNELAREQGHQGVLDMVGNGIKSGGVIIGNNGGGTSSAGEALARAYGILGRQQESKVGNQAAQGATKIQAEQDNLTAQNGTKERDFQINKADTINNIVTSAQNALALLNSQAAYASIPDRVDLDQKIAEVKAQALAALSAYDSTLTNGVAAIGPENPDQVRADASKLATAGTAPATQFDYTTAIPAQFQGSGDFASSLPIFTNQGKKQPVAA